MNLTGGVHGEFGRQLYDAFFGPDHHWQLYQLAWLD